jgi:hypothetical protein
MKTGLTAEILRIIKQVSGVAIVAEAAGLKAQTYTE